MNAADTAHKSSLPWWRYKIMWLVVGGPLVVVVAGISTAVIAIKGADPVLTQEERLTPAELRQSGVDANTPAMQARNHAATAK